MSQGQSKLLRIEMRQEENSSSWRRTWYSLKSSLIVSRRILSKDRQKNLRSLRMILEINKPKTKKGEKLMLLRINYQHWQANYQKPNKLVKLLLKLWMIDLVAKQPIHFWTKGLYQELHLRHTVESQALNLTFFLTTMPNNKHLQLKQQMLLWLHIWLLQLRFKDC